MNYIVQNRLPPISQQGFGVFAGIPMNGPKGVART
jgi:hypothetical protein